MIDLLRRWVLRLERAVSNRRDRLMLIPTESHFAMALAKTAERTGWILTTDARSASLLIALEPPAESHHLTVADHSVAVVMPGTEADWVMSGALESSDVVVVGTPASRRLLEATWARDMTVVIPDLNSRMEQLLELGCSPTRRVGVATCAPDWPAAPSWGDTYFARAVMRGFRRNGWTAKELVRQDWYGAHARCCDVVIHLRGLARRRPRPGQTNVLWIISHPERVTAEECEEYDVLASASQHHALRLSAELGRTVHYVAQGADTDTFRLVHREGALCSQVVSVSNARWPRRTAPRWLLRNGLPFRLTGSNWEGLPEAEMLAERFLANRDLSTLYRSAQVVVADHHGSMRSEGFIANRIFDALAAGGCVLSDNVIGINEVFGELVPTFDSPEQLTAQLDALTSDPERRDRLATEGRRMVLRSHTLDHRVSQLIGLIDAHKAGVT